jgi:hypothetical protein
MTNTAQRSASTHDLIQGAVQLSARFPGEPPPLRKIAHAVGIEQIDRRDLPASGLLVETGSSKYVALIRASDPPTRQRFSLAHEIAHVLVSHAGVESDLSCRRAPIERLCDRIAAELVLPATQYLNARTEPPTLDHALDVARRCRASEVASVLRLADIFPEVTVVAWATRSRPGGSAKLRILWSRSPKGKFIPEFAPPPASLDLDSLRIGDVLRARAALNLGSLRGPHLVESVRIRPPHAEDIEILSVIRESPRA